MVQLTAPGSPGVKDRNRRRIVVAARELVAADGVDALSMRALARAAGVSVRTLYNLFGTKEAILRALAVDVLETLDARIVDSDELDPIARARAELRALVDVVVTSTPPSLVLAIVDDERLVRELNAGWASRDALRSSIAAAMAVGALEPALDPRVLAEQVRHSYVRALRMWAAGVLDDARFRAGMLYVLDVALAAVAPEPTRRDLLAHARSLEAELAP